jgi:hypothetical protein
LSISPRILPLAKGIGSIFIPPLRSSHKSLGTVSAEHCYSLFLRHVSLLRRAGLTIIPSVVAELGPGSSMGTGFAALIAGAERYYALDLIDHSNVELNLRVFDELVTLFARQTPIPHHDAHAVTYPDLDSYAFPEFLAGEYDDACRKRIAAIREDIRLRSGVHFVVATPWAQSNVMKRSSIDWLFSHSVMEHVDDVSKTYEAMSLWLKPSGYATHLIDFWAHDLTSQWNGHWAIGDQLWRLLRGRRPYLLNRAWCTLHQRLAEEHGFVCRLERRSLRYDGLGRESFVSPFREMSELDAQTRMLFLVSQLS